MMVAEKEKDQRHFSRYRKKLDFKLFFKNSSFTAEAIDYSLGGIGLRIEDSPPVRVGDILNIDIPESSLKFEGRVVRAVKLNGGMKIGISRLGTLRGALREYKIADVLIGLQRSGRTGILDVMNDTVWKNIFINSGDMIFAASNQDADRLGDVLLSEGKITKEQYEKSVEAMKRTKKRHGAALVELGYLKAPELPQAVRYYVERIIESLFAFEAGDFEFREGQFKDEVVKLKLSAATLIYKGIKKIKNEEHIRRECPPLDCILSFSANPLDLFQDLRLDEADKRILSYIDGKTTIKDIVSLVRRAEDDVLKSIYALLSTRIIIVREEAELEEEVTAEEVMAETRSGVSEGFSRRLLDLYLTHEALGFYGILDVKTTATQQEIKRAFYKMAKEFHPDKHFYLQGDEKDKLNTVFASITTAYSTLINMVDRKEYDRSLSVTPEKLGSNTEKAQRKFEQGMAELKKSRLAEAERLFGEATYYDGSIPQYHYHYSVALHRLGKHKEAEKAVSRALKTDPLNVDYLTEAGHIYLSLGLPLRAKGNFERALKLNPAFEKARKGLEKIAGDLAKGS